MRSRPSPVPAPGRVPQHVCAPFILLCALIAAGPASAGPDRVAAYWEIGASITDLSITEDAVWVGIVESGASQVWFLDARFWELVEGVEACSGAVTGIAMEGTNGAATAYVGCDDGTVVSLLVSSGGTVSAGETWTIDTGEPVVAVETDGSYVYVLAEQAEGNDALHILDPAAGTVDSAISGFPTTVSWSGFEDSALVGSYFIVAHGGDNISKVDLSTGSVSTQQESLGGREMVDLATWGSVVMLADEDGGVLQFTTGDNEFNILLDTENGLVSNQALAVDGDSADPSLVVYDAGAGQAVVFPFDSSSGYPNDTMESSFDADDMVEMVVGNAYIFGGGADGWLQVLTQRPWVSVSSVSGSDFVEGDTIAVSFTSDKGGSYSIYLNGAIASWDGTVLETGNISAGQVVVSNFTVDGSYLEGENAIWVRVLSDDWSGHGGLLVSVDNPPSQVVLDQDGVGFGDQQITVTFGGISDEDLSHYLIYLSEQAFSADDYGSGGPAWEGDESIEAPFEAAAAPGEAVSHTFSPLTNGQTYYVAVRAVDTGGQEGSMSEVVSATPEETVGAAVLAGEDGGYCATSRRAGGLALVLGLLGLATRRRSSYQGAAGRPLAQRAMRHRWLPGLALLTAPWLVGESRADTFEHRARRGNVEVRYGPFFISDANLQTVYGTTGQGVIWIEGGPKVTSFFELDVGLGFYQSLSTKVSIDGSAHSAEHTMITAWPVTGGATARLDVFEEQFLVPTVGAGLDYWFWKENWYVNSDVGGDDRISGGKSGYHLALGLDLLLDKLDPSRASKLEMRTGIKDSYVMAEVRWQQVGLWDADGGLSFDGSMATFGLKFDF